MTANPDKLKLNDSEFDPKNLTKYHWMKDFEYLYQLMEENYPYFSLKERQLGYNWLDLKDQFIEKLKSTDDIIEILDIFWDAVISLQNRHTIIFIPEWLESLFEKNSWHRQQQSFNEIFNDQQKKFVDCWKPHMKTHFEMRIQTNFEVLVVYDKGEYRLVKGHGDWEDKYGANSVITKVNGTDIHDAIKKCYLKDLIDFDFIRKRCYVLKIAPRTFGSKAEFTIQKVSGEITTTQFLSSPKYVYENQFEFPTKRIVTRILNTEDYGTDISEKIGYVLINDFQDEYYEKDKYRLMKFYQEISHLNHLIIDIRWNEGGSYEPWMKNVIQPLADHPLMSKMKLAYRNGSYVNQFRITAESDITKEISKDECGDLPTEVKSDDFTVYDYTQVVDQDSSVPKTFRGAIHLLIDRFTFSATDAFALFCKETKLATLYGVPTRGDGISESPIFVVLPNSKLMIRFTPAMGIDYTGHANEEVRVQPDYYFESTFGNSEELLQYTIQQIYS